MKNATVLIAIFAALTSFPLFAQQAGVSGQQNASAAAAGAQANESANTAASATANPGRIETNSSANESAKTTYAPASGGFGDQSASHAWQMSSVSGELEGKLNSKTAKAGDRVVLRTTNKVKTADGAVIPRGSRLIGRVTEVQAHDKEHGDGRIGIVFERAELKNGQSFAIHSLIRGIGPSASAMAMSSSEEDEMMSPSIGGGGPRMGGGPGLGGGRNAGVLGSAGQTLGAAAGDSVGTMQKNIGTVDSTLNGQANAASTENGAIPPLGRVDANSAIGAHAAAANRAIPRPTGLPGVMLAGNGSASGLLSASGRNLEIDSGSQMQLGIVVDR